MAWMTSPQLPPSRETTGSSPVPVLLVHGWRGDPAVWSSLAQRLSDAEIPYHAFDYSNDGTGATGDPREYAVRLADDIAALRRRSPDWRRFDIACHSMGALVTRWYLEVLGGAGQVRQWIGICPTNRGAALADRYAGSLLGWLGTLTPAIGSSAAVLQMKTDSETVARLSETPCPSDRVCRILAGINAGGDPSFAAADADPLNIITAVAKRIAGVSGKTLAMKRDRSGRRRYVWTHLGDGIVALEQSKLANAGLDCFDGVAHAAAPRHPAVVEAILRYLLDPGRPSSHWIAADGRIERIGTYS